MASSSTWLVVAALVCAARAAIPRACSTPDTSQYPFCDPSLPLTTRINDLISRLTLEEKPYLLTARESPKGNISRLGIPEYDWGLNCIHGVQSKCGTKCPTSFPNPSGLGASFNRTIWKGMGRVIGVEMRSLWLQGVGEAHDSNLPHMGLDCWSPNLEVVRDPRWGRNMETPSEDPLLNGLYGIDYTTGLQQGDDPRFLQGVATLKHFDANSLEGNWGPGGTINRHTDNAIITNYDLASTYMMPFAYAVIEGDAKGVMCSYNAVNGVPSCANDFLLNTTLRSSWGFEGYVTSDSGAVEDILINHHYVNNQSDAVADALKAGCDVISASWPKDQPWSTGSWYIDHAADAIQSGLMTEADLDRAVFNALWIRFRLGLFDPINDQPYWHVPPEAVRTEANENLAKDATVQSLVLLQNPNSILPVPQGKTVAVIGPLGKAQGIMLGNYLGQICPGGSVSDYSCVQTPLEAIQKTNTGTTLYSQGLKSVTDTSTSGFASAVATAKQADYVIGFFGLDGSVEGEGHDRHNITLPGVQEQLIESLIATGKPVTIVLMNGGIVAIDSLKTAPAAIVEAWYTGFYGGQAIADALFGKRNSWGKMPVTVYDSKFTEEFDMLDFNMSQAPGRTYRYFTGVPLFPFGHGLSYTTFSIEFPSQPPSSLPNDFTVTVTNTGSVAGDEVIMGFFYPLDIPASSPASKLIKQLFGFERVTLQPGASTNVTFSVTEDQLATYNSDGDRVIYHGRYDLVFTNGIGAERKASITINNPDDVIVAKYPHVLG
eukprot:m.246915 g.246915  ORF g.246915 m.246915 type:complete len:772 (-) comp15227_c0_seq1:9-2324(-)